MPRAPIRQAIRKLLTDDATLVALVGGRIWSERRPPEGDVEYPCLVFQRERGKPLQNMEGNLQGYNQSSYNFKIFAYTQEQCEDVRDCVLRILPSASRSVVTQGGTVEIGGIATDDDQDIWVEDPEEDPDLWQYLVRLHVDYEEDLS